MHSIQHGYSLKFTFIHAHRPSNLLVCVISVLLMNLTVSDEVEAAQHCPDGLLGVVAQVVSIEPPSSRAVKVSALGKELPVAVGDTICVDESLLVKLGGPVFRVGIYAGGERKMLEQGQKYSGSNSLQRYDRRALELLAELVASDGSLQPPPDIPLPSVPRSASSDQKAPLEQISAMRALRGLPRQLVTREIQPLASWRGGVGPYTCQAITEQGDVIWEQSRAANISWCVFTKELEGAAQLAVRESRGPAVIWNLAWVDPSAVPRPAWMQTKAGKVSGADATAWAVWLWAHGAGEWRLHALGLLYEFAGNTWLAGYLRDRLLADVLLTQPR